MLIMASFAHLLRLISAGSAFIISLKRPHICWTKLFSKDRYVCTSWPFNPSLIIAKYLYASILFSFWHHLTTPFSTFWSVRLWFSTCKCPAINIILSTYLSSKYGSSWKTVPKVRFFSKNMMHFSHCPKNVPKTILKKIFWNCVLFRVSWL